MTDPKQVLVADDQEFWRKEVRGVVESLGYDVIEATDAAEAQVRLDAHRFDLLITDNYMGSFEAGIELLIRNKEKAIPSILHTTLITRVQQRRLMDEVPEVIAVTKSTRLDHSELLEAIHRLLG